MSVKVDATTDLAEIAERLGVGSAAELRSSTSRRQPHLRKYAKMLARNPNITLKLNPEIAAANLEVGDEIYIPTRALPQPLTDLPRRTYDMLAQETLTAHEVGHIVYSDWGSLKQCFEEVKVLVENDDRAEESTESWKAVFKDHWNAAEDGVIEDELRRRFNVKNQFEILNANLSEAGSVAPEEDGVYVYSMKDAITQGILDVSVYDSGRAESVLDAGDGEHCMFSSTERNRFEEAYEKIQQFIPQMKMITNAKARNYAFFRFWRDEMYPILLDSDTNGVENSQHQDGTGEYRSDDATRAMGGSEKELSEQPEEEEGSGGQGDGDDEPDDGSQPGSGGGDDDEGNSSESLDTDSVEEQYSEALQREAQEALGEGLMDEIETLQGALQGATDVNVDSITIPEKKEADSETQEEAKRLGRRLQHIIKDQLREARQQDFRRRKSFGTLDKRSMIDAERGSIRVFQRSRDDDERDYSCVLVMDRSSSMRGSIHEAEVSIGAFMYALENCGVDVMCLDFCDGEIRLAKPFGGDVDEFAGTLFTGECKGGTPLDDAMFFARERVEDGSGSNPFIMVATDGRAGNATAYREQLRKTMCPVIGIYLQLSRSRSRGVDVSEAPEFHRIRPVYQEDALSTVLQQLAREVLI